ncbi:FK506-binding protein-like [Tribolium madens]|uniref:FK506-binding protein-like n=1 Tax=Tribolium madens TaxID=41895 RepID=UPI001CF730D4|nr:FK506-binding protein-like [Tribolium madens]
MWISPDGKFHKLVVVEGDWGKKPSEQTECKIFVSDCPDSFLEYNNTSVVIGDSDSETRRNLDLCLITMNEGETAKFRITAENVSFTLKLENMKFNSYIYEWDAKKKYEIAQHHKERGVELYKQNRGKDAAHRFIRGLKVLSSIPIDVETPPEQIDTIPLDDINKLKANLYNNLASFYLKKQDWLLTIGTCKRVFDFDKDSVKAHYKLAVAYIKDKNLEAAEKELDVVLAAEPNNRAAIDHMKHVKEEIRKANVKFNMMVKKMFT